MSSEDLLALAVRTAHAAGDFARDGRATAMDVQTKSSSVDVVTVMDTATEALITRTILEARPDDGMLGEEGADVVGTSGVRWVVDPIDGTVNYLYRIPAWAVSIAAELDGVAVAGVVYNPVLRETYTATIGGGAFCNGVPLACSAETVLAQTLLGTGFGYDSDRRRRQGALVAQLLPFVRDIRRFGSAALDLCAVASGRLDAYFERGLNPWDMAAGALIAREAGARIEGLAGATAGGELVIAAPPGLFDALHDLLAPLAPASG
ncbi:MAG: inositol monophosphatase [Frankiales bacterium]|nr:inositol monophosphatase [Frankiales bacterium]